MSDELRLRMRMIGAGLWLSVVLVCAAAAWIATTWERPHRVDLVALVGGSALVTSLITLLPRERIVSSRWREPFFLSWSLSLIGLVATAADLDAGLRSPVVLILFLTLVYAALSYPRWAVAVVSLASLLAVLFINWTYSGVGTAAPNTVYVAGLMLTLAVTGAMCITQSRIQEQTRRALQHVSRTDPLTGALNRLGFTERMDNELARGALHGSAVALVLLDFDGFKEVNDGHGHSAGDALLCWSVQAMRSALRSCDSLARLGGDEFAAVLPETSLREAATIADRLRLALSLRIGASAGIAATDCDGTGVEQLHRCADQRLYAAKHARPVGVAEPSEASRNAPQIKSTSLS